MRTSNRKSMVVDNMSESSRSSMVKKPTKVFRMGAGSTANKWDSLKPTIKKAGKTRKALNNWDDAASTGSREGFKRTMSITEETGSPVK
jgi:hypothetical protein